MRTHLQYKNLDRGQEKEMENCGEFEIYTNDFIYATLWGHAIYLFIYFFQKLAFAERLICQDVYHFFRIEIFIN